MYKIVANNPVAVPGGDPRVQIIPLLLRTIFSNLQSFTCMQLYFKIYTYVVMSIPACIEQAKAVAVSILLSTLIALQ